MGARRPGVGVGMLRGPGSGPNATFAELFFDLVVVFALTRLAAQAVSGLSAASSSTRWLAAGQTLLLFLPLTWAWTITSYVTARFEPRRVGVRLAVVASAFGLFMMASAVPAAFDARGMIFALSYVLLQVGRTVGFGLLLGGLPLRRLYFRAGAWYCLSAIFWIWGATVGETARTVLWTVAITVDLGAARLGWPLPRLGRGRAAAWATGGAHLSDRYRQFLMIALGEGVISVGIAYTKEGTPESAHTCGVVVAFVTTVLLWRIYFFRSGELLGEAVDAAGDRAAFGRSVAFAHTVMIFGIVVVAVGYGLVLDHPFTRPYPVWLAVVLGGPLIYLLGRARLERLVFDRVSPRRLLGVACLVVLALPGYAAGLLVASIGAALVLLLVAVLDARAAVRVPDERPVPAR
ncbi:low temperature requirement protein A [Micromonospora maritima]|uniref:low temperature requirement protein A n=1 Tax=Micromonospora maritima TaxID=986711 RepID=UPI00157DC35C|nr:low temperature requirement protein A [Micromonospora maritima]